VTKLGSADSASFAAQVPGWQVEADVLVKVFPFKNYYETMAFVNMVAWIAHREDHHPDMTVSYNKCRVAFSTHSVGGLSENDFICAAKIESALSA
jgi:4a-hydroxytetrahydrobiopterin dehydratase